MQLMKIVTMQLMRMIPTLVDVETFDPNDADLCVVGQLGPNLGLWQRGPEGSGAFDSETGAFLRPDQRFERLGEYFEINQEAFQLVFDGIIDMSYQEAIGFTVGVLATYRGTKDSE